MSSAEAGRGLLQAVKRSAVSTQPMLVIPVGSPVRAILRPVATNPDRLNRNDILCLTDWRNRFVDAFLTEFTATPARTARWLTEIVGPSDTKILFMADDLHGGTFGYLGLAFIDWENGWGEADAVVRGGQAAKGTMFAALRTLLGWAEGQLGLKRLGVRVRSDNEALEFYKKLGFQETRRVPLVRSVDADVVCWVESDPPAASATSLVYMELARPPHPQ